ncbi:minor capsid protein [Sporanaerobacter sp. PP17-6a]|uniref:minor capsid protein n=1 Tax=Sporanaerobacter sp. PP17-6a TaxID=1891289 RepID=UPI0008A02020|nr:minor capsid protein [Sporanaerobacter sp. PP17-6a]SCL85070.1 NAD(+)-arginine ADP-ribosyltransferase EFV [Sporanaerobacter sp. PP17-6a]
MPNSYWEKRQEQKYLAGEMKIKEYYKRLEKTFEQSKGEIQSVINDFYVRYMNENKIVSYADAQKLLSKVEIGDLKDFIAKVNEHMGEYNLELNNMSIKARMTRYQVLEKQIDAILQRLYSIDYQAQGEDVLKDVYSDAYYKTWYNIDQYHGFHQEFAQVNPHTIEELIKYPFNGADFSTRIWKEKDHMLQQLNESITTMLVQGKNPSTLSRDFAKKFDVKEYEAYRLLHTESSFIMEQATLEGYKEDGVTKYQILATLDMKTSDICRSEDGKIYDVEKATVGVNYPPYHIFCRTTTVPYYDDNDTSEDTRVARDPVTGKGYEAPADMNYTEWHKKYVESNPEAITAEKKWKNRHSDRAQYERYKEVLGKDIPNSFDKFQDMKYNNIKEWDNNKRIYKALNLDGDKIYEIAKSGGRHKGTYEKASIKYSDAQIKKSINSHQKQIDEHKDKIRNPEKYDKDWNNKSAIQQEGLIRKWSKDLKRNREEQIIFEKFLKGRGE